ncbi:hypothetical protein H7A76_07900 [Pseudomonas sp. MSSRFD41]|uniref:hypothetical protein n=1 Tax=Pseudomonas sp. MSSRFD41 TaxID=1310370 RepID=UPI00163AEAC6|nr:hypothetical protein [Pseudomonas sp. MSSRFD41]MBC2655359.1 hypothetical protein [Pseudomonas sp. MSSRFD41]
MSAITGKPVKVDRGNFYGFAKRDLRKTSTDIATLLLEHDFNDHLSLRNTTRQGCSMQDYILSRPTFGSEGGHQDPALRCGDARPRAWT